MSGGSLNYFYLQLQEHIGDFGDEELDDLVKDLADLFYAREWYLSSDTCKDDWREARDKFKDKWFTEYGRQERIKKYLEEIRSNVLDMLGIDDRKRDTCEYWSHVSDNREVFSTCNQLLRRMRGMKLYRKLIKPVVAYPDTEYNQAHSNLEETDAWYPEEEKEQLYEKYKHLEAPCQNIMFLEKYEEVKED